MTTMNALKILTPFSSASLDSPSAVLASLLPSSSSHPSVSLDHVYTSHDIDSYLSEQSIIESHEIVLSDSSTTHAIKFKLGFLMVDEVVVDQFAVS